MNVIPCPRCYANVIVPAGTPDAAVVRCPLCAAEYALGDALTQAFPPLIVVSLPEAAATTFEPTDTTGGLYTPAFDTGPTSDHTGAAEPVSLGAKPKPAKARRSAGGILQTAGVVLGGLMAIPLAQLVLWYLPGNLRRDFGFGPTVAKVSSLRWLVPEEFRGEKAEAAESPDAAPAPEPAASVKPATPAPEKKKDEKSETAASDHGDEIERAVAAKKLHDDLPAVYRPEPDPTGSPSTPGANSTAAKPAPTENSEPLTAGTPHAAVTQCYVAAVSDDEKLSQSLRWWPAGERPVLALRWAVGVTILGWTTPPAVRDEESLDRFTAGLGPKLRNPLVERQGAEAFGHWPATAGEPLGHVLLSAGTRAALVETARAQGVDALVQIELDQKVTPGTGARDYLAKVRLIDVDGAPSGRNVWFSAERLLKEALSQPKNMQAFASTVLAEVDAKFALQPPSGLTAAQAQARVEKLDPLPGLATLRTLAEVRYYQTHQLIDPAAAEAAYEKLLGKGKGHAFATGTPTDRKLLAAGVVAQAKE